MHPYERKYLIAHALSHHLFHRTDLFRDYISLHEKGIFGNRELGRFEIATKEREADIFAAYFLIPEEKLKPILEKEWVRGSPNPIPEIDSEDGRKAKKKLEDLISGKYVDYEEQARDVYGRLIVQAWVDSVNVNDAMNSFFREFVKIRAKVWLWFYRDHSHLSPLYYIIN